MQSAYLEHGASLLKKVGIDTLENVPPKPEEEVECRICDDDFSPEDTLANGCGHRFCKACWVDYLRDKVSLGPSSVLVNCPSFECPGKVTDTMFEVLLGEEDNVKRNKHIRRSFVEGARRIKWCPAPGCDNAIEVNHLL